MSERLKINYEIEPGDYERIRKDRHEKAHSDQEIKRPRHEHREKLADIKEKIEKEAKRSDETKVEKALEEKAAAPPTPAAISSDLSSQALHQNLKMIQRSLSGPEKIFSKIIHNPTIDLISEAGSKTIARPSGLLFGGSFALFTNIAVIIISRHFGYEYNYLIGIASFGVGFIAGLLAELLYRQVLRRR